MKLALVGKSASITHWLEEAAASWRGDGHQVMLSITRRPWLAAPLESAMCGPIAGRLCSRLARFAPDLIVAIGAYHVPAVLLAAIADLPGRPPVVGWVGDRFGREAAARAARFDLVGYADSALLARHRDWGFDATAIYLPHAIDPHHLAPTTAFEARSDRMVFIGTPTPGRREVVSAVRRSMTLYGPGWRSDPVHEVHPGRLAAARVPTVLAAHRFALNVRNEVNVVSGLNQRNFQPCAAGTALLTDDQPDLQLCFDPGVEVLVWRDGDELNALYDKVHGDAALAADIAARGRARVLADHTYAHRLASLGAALGGLPKPALPA